jgi:hypothetical protein
MALLTKFVPNFDDCSDDQLRHQLHCWQHCALVTFRTQRQVALMHTRHLKEELQRREAARMFADAPMQSLGSDQNRHRTTS